MNTTNHTDLIKDKLSILDVVGSYVKLEKAGKTWKGKSPFTNEKTPSFFVSPEKGFFYCFSSGKGGDIFTFIQEIERIEFREALKLLAQQAGVTLRNDNKNYSKQQRLYQLLDTATKWFELNLRKNKDAVAYLQERGLEKDTMASFRLGFAQNKWDDIFKFLKKQGFIEDEILRSGLVVKKDKGGYYDRFRSRIMFPLRDTRGRVVGFSGRIFGDDQEKTAKYINSPDTELYDKSNILYGYDTAKQAIAEQNFCIIVEGQFDVVLSQQAGFLNTVAVSGTGLSDEHIKKIQRFSESIYFAFDADKAGIKAVRRNILKTAEHGLQVKAVVLPEGKDPADVITQSPSRWEIAIADALPYLSYRMRLFESHHPKVSFDERYALAQNDLFDVIALVPKKIQQEKMLQEVADFLGVSYDSVKSDFTDRELPTEIQTVIKEQEAQALPTEQPPGIRHHDIRQQLQVMGKRILEQEPEKDDALQDALAWYEQCYKVKLSQDLQNLEKEQQALLGFIAQEEEQYQQPLPVLIESFHDTILQTYIKQLRTRSQENLSRMRQLERSDPNGEALQEIHKDNHSILTTIDRLTNLQK